MKIRIAILSMLLAGMVAVVGCGAKKAPTTAPAPVTAPVIPKIEDQFLGQWEPVTMVINVITRMNPNLQITSITDAKLSGLINIEADGSFGGNLTMPSEYGSRFDESYSVTGTWEILKETYEIKVSYNFEDDLEPSFLSLYLKYRFEDDKNNNTRYLYLEGKLFDTRTLSDESRKEFEKYTEDLRQRNGEVYDQERDTMENSKIVLIFKQNLSGK